MAELSYRYATEKDVELILFFIKELAEYEKMLDEVVASEELLKEWIFKYYEKQVEKMDVHILGLIPMRKIKERESCNKNLDM